MSVGITTTTAAPQFVNSYVSGKTQEFLYGNSTIDILPSAGFDDNMNQGRKKLKVWNATSEFTKERTKSDTVLIPQVGRAFSKPFVDGQKMIAQDIPFTQRTLDINTYDYVYIKVSKAAMKKWNFDYMDKMSMRFSQALADKFERLMLTLFQNIPNTQSLTGSGSANILTQSDFEKPLNYFKNLGIAVESLIGVMSVETETRLTRDLLRYDVQGQRGPDALNRGQLVQNIYGIAPLASSKLSTTGGNIVGAVVGDDLLGMAIDIMPSLETFDLPEENMTGMKMTFRYGQKLIDPRYGYKMLFTNPT